MKDFKQQLIAEAASIIDALIKLNSLDIQNLFVVDRNERLVGTLTDGDIRRGLIIGKNTSDKVETFMRIDFHFLKNTNNTDNTVERIRIIKNEGIKLLPVIDENQKIVRLIDFTKTKTILPVDAIIMAGGKGERLKPLTDNLPKPLLKIGRKPIIEHVIDRLFEYGIDNYYITLNYLGQQIIDFIEKEISKNKTFTYVKEEKPLGTIGAVGLIEQFKHENILLMNSDILTDLDFEDFYMNFIKEKADVAIATIPYSHNLPYAVLGVKGNNVHSLEEKPTYTYFSNAGIYLFKKSLVKNIPLNEKYNATDFIQNAIDDGLKVINYPILGYWEDIGKHEDLKKVQEFYKYIKH
jgi:dTDP-glucose pyrophosphorylase